MSPQANTIMRTARVQAKRDTSDYNPSDAYIAARKFAKEAIAKSVMLIINSYHDKQKILLKPLVLQKRLNV